MVVLMALGHYTGSKVVLKIMGRFGCRLYCLRRLILKGTKMGP